MNQQPQPRHQEIRLRRVELQRQENEARSIPYISFILTHVALVLFLIAAFVVDRLIANSTISLVVKISISVIAVVFLASEWVYAIITSRRWKKNISALLQLEEDQRNADEQEQQRQHENALAVEQLRNRALQYNLRNRRDQRTPFQPIPQSGPINRSQPNSFTDPFNHNQPQSNPQWSDARSQFDFTRSFDEWNVNPPQYPFDEPPSKQPPWFQNS